MRAQNIFRGFYMKIKRILILVLTFLLSLSVLSLLGCGKAKYTITFDANGGTMSQQTKTVVYEEVIGEMPTPVKEGYAFGGWQLVTTGDNVVIVEDNYNYFWGSDITLKAIWNKKITVTLDADGGTFDGENTLVIIENSKLGELPTPVKNDYVFVGWFKADGIEATSETVVKFDGTNDTLAIKAKYNKLISISFDIGDGTIGGSATIEPIVVEQTKLIGTLPKPIANQNDKKFSHWELGNTGIKVLDDQTCNYDTDVTLVAVYDYADYSITLSVRGGVFEDGANVRTIYSKNDPDYVIPRPTKTDYVFVGWSVNDDVSTAVLDVTIPTGSEGDRTYYAHWSPAKYYVRIDVGNDGTPAYDGELEFEVAYGTSLSGALLTPTNENAAYKFYYWSINETGSEVKLDLNKVTHFTADVFGTDTEVLIKANWFKGYVVKIDTRLYPDNPNSGLYPYDLDLDTEDIELTFGATYGSKLSDYITHNPENYDRNKYTHYEFKNWKYKNANGEWVSLTGNTVFNESTFGDLGEIVICIEHVCWIGPF